MLPDRYVSRKHESKVPCLYPDGRYVIASTYDPELAGAFIRAFMDLADDAGKQRMCASPDELGVEG